MKTKLVVLLVVAAGCAVAGAVIVRNQALRKAASQTVKADREADLAKQKDQARRAAAPVSAPAAAVATPPPERTSPEPIADYSADVAQTQAVKADRQVSAKPPPAPRPARTPAPAPADVLVPEPVARQALSLVGADAEAETIWSWAINDPNLSRDERRELIEDLNRDGFSDPRNPGVEDLPLIESRIFLIQGLAPYAMDEVNAAAFAEAYKDLVNMYLRLTGF
jgi:hypothetical protein